MIYKSYRQKSICSFNLVIAAKIKMHDLSPVEKSRRTANRIARGYGGKGGGTGGRGTRGQKSRSGGGVRPGFQGGQTPLYRRLPKLKGIAGGMKRSEPDFVTVNLDELGRSFDAYENVSLERLTEKRVLNITGKDRKLALKVLGRGSLGKALTVRAKSFSSSAKSKIVESGGHVEIIS